jgi:putative transposase
VRAPRANAIAERFVGTVRRELLNHLLIINHRHGAAALKRYARHYNEHRHTAPLARPLPYALCPTAPQPRSTTSDDATASAA